MKDWKQVYPDEKHGVIALDPVGIRGDEPMTEETVAAEMGNLVRFAPSDEK